MREAKITCPSPQLVRGGADVPTSASGLPRLGSSPPLLVASFSHFKVLLGWSGYKQLAQGCLDWSEEGKCLPLLSCWLRVASVNLLPPQAACHLGGEIVGKPKARANHARTTHQLTGTRKYLSRVPVPRSCSYFLVTYEGVLGGQSRTAGQGGGPKLHT